MPAKKTTKRGKVPTKAETMSVPEDTNPLSSTEELATTNMNATFIVENNSNGEKSNNGLSGCGDADGADNVAGIKNGKLATKGDGDAGGFLDDIEKDEASEMNPPKNVKGKTGSKKNKLVEPEPGSELADHVDEEDEVSPKRALEEDEDMVQEPPSKRREKAAKKVTSRRDRKAKVELDVMAPEENADENTSPEEAAEDETVEQVAPKRGRGGKTAPATKKGRKGKGDVEAEPSDEKPNPKESSPENDSPMEMDGDEDEDAEDVDDVKEDTKPAKKRAGRVVKEKPVLQPSTRTTRSRKQVTYTEKEDDEEEPEDFKDKKIKKTTASKKAPAQSKKPKEVAPKPAASTKRKGRPPKATTEMKKEEEADE